MSNPRAPESSPAPRSRRWRRVLVGVVIVLLLVVGFAPAIVAKTPLLNTLVYKALADVDGTVAVGGASLGWFSPIELRDVRVTDRAGQPVIVAPRIVTAKSLLSLAISRREIGAITFDQPTVDLATEKGRTNIEAVFAKYFESEGSPPAPQRTPFAIVITNGTLHLRDQSRTIASVNVDLHVPESRAEPITLGVKSPSLTIDAGFGAETRWHVAATDFPLEILEPFARSLDSTLTMAGSLTGDVKANWSEGFTRFRIDGTPRITNLDLSASGLRGDRLRLASVELPLAIDGSGPTLKIEKAALTCDLGKASIQGEFATSGSLDSYLDHPGVTASADLDLAKLAKALPRWTSLRSGTAVSSGSVSLHFASTATTQGTTWTGRVNAADLRAVRDGKSLEWLEPLSVTLSVGFPKQGLPTVESFVCRSDVLALQARGTSESFKAAANIYLDRLTQRLGEFVDLGGIALAGQAVVRAEVSRTPATGAFTSVGSVELTNIAYADATGANYREPRLDARLEAAGVYHPRKPVRLESGGITVTAAEDALELRLLEPMANVASLASGKIGARLTGSLARWKSRIEGFVPFPAGWQLAGIGSASTNLSFSGQDLKCEALACAFDNFLFQGEGVEVREAKLGLEGNILLHRDTGGVDATGLKLTATSATAAIPRIALEPQPGGDKALVGNGTFSVDVAALERWMNLVDPRGPGLLAGRAAGDFRLNAVKGVTDFQLACDVKDFTVGPKTAPTWAEPTLTITAEGALDPARDELRLRSAKVLREGLGIQADGTYSRLMTTQDVDFKGTVNYDLAKLTPLLRGFVGGSFDATGTGTKPFRIAGSLVPRGSRDMTLANLTASAGVNWQSVQAYGFDVGPGELNTRLAKGTLTANRVDAKFGGGEVHATPTVRLEPSPMTLSVEPGPIVQNASLTPKSCAGALGYALPVVANAVQADGKVSFTIAENSVPVADMTQAMVKGSLLVHKASVGTGPVIGEIAKLLGAAATSVTLANDMTVPIRVEKGRVHHENLRLTVNGFAVTTNGSVGFDGSVSIVADVPVPAQALFKNNPRLMQALKDRTIKVPIAGTLSKPALDPKGFENAIAQLVRDATKNVAADLIKGGLDKLLPPKK